MTEKYLNLSMMIWEGFLADEFDTCLIRIPEIGF